MNPSSEKIFAVAQTFVDAQAAYPDGKINMSLGGIRKDKTECGTFGCHAGWYSVGKAIGRLKFNADKTTLGGDMLCFKNNVPVNYDRGQHKMAWDLGFKTIYDLLDWAEEYPEVWGSRHGDKMFESSKAFGGDDDSLSFYDHSFVGETLRGSPVAFFAGWWNNVAKRVEALENEQRTI